MSAKKLRIGIQKKGRLSLDSIKLIKDSGIEFSSREGTLFTESINFPMEIIFLRDDDIPEYVADGTLDIGIVGHNEVEEKNEQIDIVKYLGFAKCHLAIAAPTSSDITCVEDLEGKTVATSYPNILRRYLQKKGIKANIQKISGSVEIAPGIGLADAIFDIVQTGSTLIINGLKEVEVVFYSEAVLIANPELDFETRKLLDKFLFQLESYMQAKSLKYIDFNIPNSKLPEIIKIFPENSSLSVNPLYGKESSNVMAIIQTDLMWDIIRQIKAVGGSRICILPVEKMIL